MLKELQEVREFLDKVTKQQFVCAGDMHLEARKELAKLDAVINTIKGKDND